MCTQFENLKLFLNFIKYYILTPRITLLIEKKAYQKGVYLVVHWNFSVAQSLQSSLQKNEYLMPKIKKASVFQSLFKCQVHHS